MPVDLLPVARTADQVPDDDPQAVVEAFLAALAASDLDSAMPWLADDVVYSNVGLPTVNGRDDVARAFRALGRPSVSFEVFLHSIAASGPVVVTERTDVIEVGPFRTQFWVWGRFDVHDGRITLWRDSFDFLDVARSVGRGLAGIAVPRFRPVAPSGPDALPGR